MPLAGSESEIVKSLEWAVEEMSFLLCNFLVRLLYHPQSSYIITVPKETTPVWRAEPQTSGIICEKTSDILTQCLQDAHSKNKQ